MLRGCGDLEHIRKGIEEDLAWARLSGNDIKYRYCLRRLFEVEAEERRRAARWGRAA